MRWHPCFERLNRILEKSGFDAFVEGLCAVFYAERMGRPSLRPGRQGAHHRSEETREGELCAPAVNSDADIHLFGQEVNPRDHRHLQARPLHEVGRRPRCRQRGLRRHGPEQSARRLRLRPHGSRTGKRGQDAVQGPSELTPSANARSSPGPARTRATVRAVKHAVEGRRFVAESSGPGGTWWGFTGLTPELRLVQVARLAATDDLRVRFLQIAA